MGQPEIFTAAYYERIAAYEERYWWHLGMREIALAMLRGAIGTQPVGRALDAGCGPGGTLLWLTGRLGVRRAVGVDLAPAALSICCQRGLPEVALATVMTLPFADRSFDLVVSKDVLQHLPTNGGDVVALREALRVLRPGGHLLIRANSRLGMGQPVEARDEDFQRYDLAGLTRVVEAAGFEVCLASYANALPALAAVARRKARLRRPVAGRLYEGLPLRERTTLPRGLNMALLALMRGEGWLIGRWRARIPFGHTTFCLARRPQV